MMKPEVKNLQRLSLFMLTLTLSFNLQAQVDDFDDGESANNPEPSKLSVDNKDLKALSDARASKNEEALIKAASRILGADAKNLIALNTLGAYYFEQGKYGLARIIYSRALKDHTSEPALHNNLGIIYLSEGKQRQALTEFRKALEIKSDYRISAANLGSIFLEYKDFERAMKPLEAGYKATRSELKAGTPYAVESANNYAIALSGAGKLDSSKEVYEEIMSGGGAKNPTVMLNYAILLVEKLKNYKEGSKLLSRVKFAVEDGKILKRVEELEAKVSSGDK